MADTTDEAPQVPMIRAWLGERTQGQGAAELAVSQQTISSLLRGWEPGLDLKLKLKKRAGVPLSVWPTQEVITDSDLAVAVDEAS